VVLVLAAPVVPREATALDKVVRGQRRQMETALPVHRPKHQVPAQWERRQVVRSRK
jgi:hypothetical protein